ncbi:MAG: hypothetical protein DMG25_02875 [Acidobacteria bacterium]|nr:MAG: hypothetical protein DMG25_02875 [Acidobacteriota bacterium]
MNAANATFVKRYADKARKQISKIDKSTLKLCQSYRWPGNIRELQNIIERSVIPCTGDTFWIDEAWLSSQDAPRLESSGPLTQNLQNYEKELIEAALAESNGKVAGYTPHAVPFLPHRRARLEYPEIAPSPALLRLQMMERNAGETAALPGCSISRPSPGRKP